MKNKFKILFLILVLGSCNTESEKNSEASKSVRSEMVEQKEKKDLEIDNDYSISAELFAKEVLNDNFRIHKFDVSSTEKPQHLGIFQSDGLQKIVAYSSLNYPKFSEPNYYEHFILFVASYKEQPYAQNTYNRIRNESSYRYSDLQNLKGDLAESARALIVGAKPGGMIVRKGKWIFSLVETCRQIPIGENWEDYENIFLEYISEDGEEIEVLNANCGSFKYVIENRYAIT